MVLYAYRASHEQCPPSALVCYTQLAEQAGFTAASSSEHLQPWSPRQGQNGFAWGWLVAAMPAAATLAELFPGRFHLALGSGEALNEQIVGGPWPPKPERHARLRECRECGPRTWRPPVRISADPAQHLAGLQQHASLGVS